MSAIQYVLDEFHKILIELDGEFGMKRTEHNFNIHAEAAAELADKEAVILAAQKVLEQFQKNGRMFDALMELEAALKGVK